MALTLATTLEVTCTICKQPQKLIVKTKDLKVYQSPKRPHVQVIFPYLKAAERELLISGICDTCWNKWLAGEGDE